MKEVIVYSKGYCPYCQRAIELFRNKGVDITVIDAMQKVEEFERIKAQTGSRTVPQIFIDGEFVGGCDDVLALEASNKLNEKIGI